LELGLDALRESLCQLFLTSPRLGKVRLRRRDGGWETWDAQAPIDHPGGENHRRERIVVVRDEASGTQTTYVVYRFSKGAEARSGVQFVAEAAGTTRTVRRVPSAPRLFRTFPIRGSHRLPTALTFDGPFEVEQERRDLILSEETLRFLTDAI